MHLLQSPGMLVTLLVMLSIRALSDNPNPTAARLKNMHKDTLLNIINSDGV